MYLSSCSLPPLFHPLPGLAGPRPYGLEEDVRQYEQDLAKRLYQARVRASQGTAEAPQPPTSSCTSSSAASQLRSAPRPQPPGPDARHHGGVLGCFGVGVFLPSSERSKQALAATLRQCFHCLSSAVLLLHVFAVSSSSFPLSLFSVLSPPSLQHCFSFAPCCSLDFHTIICTNTKPAVSFASYL